jgi:hypothetical protein
VAKSTPTKSNSKRATKKAGRSQRVLPAKMPPVGCKTSESHQSVISKAEVKKIQGLLKSKTTKGVILGLSLLESLSATTADYQAVFTEPVIRTIVRTWDAEAVLETAKHLLPHLDTCTRFIGIAAESFCKTTDIQRQRFLNDLFQQPFCSIQYTVAQGHRLVPDIVDGTVLWDVLHRELLEAERVKIRYHNSEDMRFSTCVVHSLDGIHIAGFFFDEGELCWPSVLPQHVLAVGCTAQQFLGDSSQWLEVAWAISRSNFVEYIKNNRFDIWDNHDWAYFWDDCRDVLIIALLWSWFHDSPSSKAKTKARPSKHSRSARPYRWTTAGLRAMLKYSHGLLRRRRFENIATLKETHKNGVLLPWQEKKSIENEWEARLNKDSDSQNSYCGLSNELKRLAYLAALSLRDTSAHLHGGIEDSVSDHYDREDNPYSVIHAVATHTLLCLALHPATPGDIVRQLAADAYGPIAAAASSGRSAKRETRSPAQQMTALINDVIRGTGGLANNSRIPGTIREIAKRLDHYWSKWRKSDSLENVAAVNTDGASANENRMRAVALGVAVEKGWIVPTREGISLMRRSVTELDALASKKSNDDNDDD